MVLKRPLQEKRNSNQHGGNANAVEPDLPNLLFQADVILLGSCCPTRDAKR